MDILGNKEELNKYLQIMKTSIQGLIENNKLDDSQKSKWLELLYEENSKMMISDNRNIWTTASIMIPLSFAPLIALSSIQHPNDFQINILALASIIIISTWLVIAENHRAFQEKSRAWMIAIEETIGLQNIGINKIFVNIFNRVLTFRGAVQIMRWGLVILMIIGWRLIYINWPR